MHARTPGSSTPTRYAPHCSAPNQHASFLCVPKRNPSFAGMLMHAPENEQEEPIFFLHVRTLYNSIATMCINTYICKCKSSERMCPSLLPRCRLWGAYCYSNFQLLCGTIHTRIDRYPVVLPEKRKLKKFNL